MLKERDLALDGVVELRVDAGILQNRVENRLREAAARGEPVRSDDDPEVLKRRLDAYREQTAPLVDYYRWQGSLKSVDGMQEIDAVESAIHKALTEKPPVPKAAPKPAPAESRKESPKQSVAAKAKPGSKAPSKSSSKPAPKTKAPAKKPGKTVKSKAPAKKAAKAAKSKAGKAKTAVSRGKGKALARKATAKPAKRKTKPRTPIRGKAATRKSKR
jgi:adenylate kinase